MVPAAKRSSKMGEKAGIFAYIVMQMDIISLAIYHKEKKPAAGATDYFHELLRVYRYSNYIIFWVMLEPFIFNMAAGPPGYVFRKMYLQGPMGALI